MSHKLHKNYIGILASKMRKLIYKRVIWTMKFAWLKNGFQPHQKATRSGNSRSRRMTHRNQNATQKLTRLVLYKLATNPAIGYLFPLLFPNLHSLPSWFGIKKKQQKLLQSTNRFLNYITIINLLFSKFSIHFQATVSCSRKGYARTTKVHFKHFSIHSISLTIWAKFSYMHKVT